MSKRTRIVVTGAEGFIGSAVCDHLFDTGVDVVGIDIAPKLSNRSYVRHQHSVSSNQVEEVLVSTEIVIHSAWVGFPGDLVSIQADFEQNIRPTIELYIRCCEASVKKFVFLSSGGTVYGETTLAPIAEGTPLDPISPYGAGKVAAETYLKALSRERSCKPTILRIANSYGPGQIPWRGQGVVPTAIACALSGTKLQIWGDGEAVRDYIYIGDVARAISELACDTGVNDIYNVGSGVGLSLNDCLRVVEDAVGERLIVERLPARGMDVARNVLDISHLRETLNWAPKTTIEVGVRHCLRWLLDNRALWLSNSQANP